MCLTRLEKASIPELPTLTVTYNDDDDDDDIENKQGRPPPSPQRAMSQYSLHFSILKRGQFFAASDKFRGKVFGDGMGEKRGWKLTTLDIKLLIWPIATT